MGDPPKVELDADEKKQFFFKHEVKDLTPIVFSSSFSKFTIPEKDEGFDDIKFEWAKDATKSAEYLKTWVMDKKLNMRVEELVPGAWSQKQMRDWSTATTKW